MACKGARLACKPTTQLQGATLLGKQQIVCRNMRRAIDGCSHRTCKLGSRGQRRCRAGARVGDVPACMNPAAVASGFPGCLPPWLQNLSVHRRQFGMHLRGLAEGHPVHAAPDLWRLVQDLAAPPPINPHRHFSTRVNAASPAVSVSSRHVPGSYSGTYTQLEYCCSLVL